MNQQKSATRIVFVITSLMMSVLFVNAQKVAIPDSLFANWLKQNGFNNCIDSANNLDTTCPAVLSTTYLDISYTQVNNLSGIQYFKGLDSLRCNADTTLTNIPALPPLLQVFECRNNQLDSLPALPSTLIRFACEFNKLGSLPALPPSLQYLSCFNNVLDSLPALPSSIQYLYCSGNKIASINALPSGLIIFSASFNQLSSLPVLPSGLQELLCSNNSLTSIPSLPASLRYLSCYYNNLGSLPALPDSLNFLACHYNHLSSLPALPAALVALNCEFNSLTTLPALPDSMFQLFCDNNPITCLPVLNTIYDLEYYNSGTISCVPNYGNVYISDPPLVSLPLCDSSNNPSGCLEVSGINSLSTSTFVIYPNPANEMVTIVSNAAMPGEQVEIRDIAGRLVNHFTLNSTRYALPLSGFSAGLYFVEITGAGGKSDIHKLIISR